MPEWCEFVWQAWPDLRDDRHYGAMGGLGRIWYDSISSYARDHGIRGALFADFKKLLRAMDDEYIAFTNERQAAEAEAAKNRQRTEH